MIHRPLASSLRLLALCAVTASLPRATADINHAAEDELAAAAAALAPAFDPERDAVTIEKLLAQQAGTTPTVRTRTTLATTATAVSPLSTQGSWGSIIPWTPHIPVTVAILPNGRMLTFASNQRTTFPSGPEFTFAAIWDPATGQFTEVNNTRHDMFCGGTAFLPDGRLVVNGGRATTVLSSIFDWNTSQWSALPNMNDPRWYNPSVTLPDGGVFTVSGSGGSNTAERWDPATGWRRLSGVNWSTVTAEPGYINIWHPFIMHAPNGRLFHFGPTRNMNWVDPAGTGSLTRSGQTVPGTHYPKEGAWAMYAEGQILVAGGGATTTSGSDSTTGTSTNAAYNVDLRGSTPVITSVSPMTFRRQFANTVILPNGELMIIGGNAGAKFSDAASVLTPEIWNPTTRAWRTVANHAVPRNYHSCALLLPDGRVWAGGGGLGGNSADHRDAEIFTPPSLFTTTGTLAPRPSLTQVPARIGVGTRFAVTATPGLSRFTMIRLASQTHSYSTDLRFLEVSFSETSPGTYELAANDNINVLMPGYWMLFGLDTQGVHSTARILQVDPLSSVALTNPGNQASHTGDAITLNLSATAPAGSLLTYSASGLPPGLVINTTTGTITGSPTTTGSFAVTVVASSRLSTASQAFSWTVAPISRSHRFASFTSASELTLNGNASITSPVLRLTSATANQVGSTFLTQQFPVKEDTSFTTRFVFGHWGSADGADGHAFVIQGSSASQTGIGGGGLGYQGMTRSLAIEFDTFASPGDPNANHIGVVRDGNPQSHLATFTPSFDLEDEQNHTAWVEYDGTVNTLRVYLSQIVTTVRPATPVITLTNIDLPTLIGPQAWFGFTAATGGSVNAHDIAAWDLALHATRLPGLSSPPVVTTPTAQTSVTGSPVSFQIVASDPDNDPLTYSATGIPAGLSLSPTSGLISGTPTTTGTSTVSISVSDGTNTPVTTTFLWTVNAPFTLGTLSGNSISTGASTTFTVTATGGRNIRYRWNFGDGSPETAISSSPSASYTFASPGRYLITVTAIDDTGRTLTSSFYQGVSAPLTARAPAASSTILFERRTTGNSRLWVVNPDSDSVTVLDAVTRVRLAETPVPASPQTLALAPDGRIWVACAEGAQIAILSPTTFAVVQSLAQPRGSAPYGIAFDPAGTAAWLTLESTGRLLRLHPSTGALLQDINVGQDVRHLSISSDGSRIYVSRFITPLIPGEATATVNTTGRGGEVVVVDGNASTVLRTIILQHSDVLDTTISGRGIPNYLGAPVITPDGLSAWVPSKQDNIKRGKLRDGLDLTHESAIRQIASRINITTQSEDLAARIDFDNAGTPTAVCYDPAGIYGFTALEGSRAIAVFDVWNRREITRFPAGRAPQGLTLSPDGNTLFVQNFMDRNITVHDVGSIIRGGNIPAATLATVSTTSREKLTARNLLGKQLFYDTQDNRLALQEYISCASCHADGGHDGRVWDFTGFGEGLRNTITLRGHANHGAIHWSGNFDEIQDFEGQIRRFAGGTGLIANGTPHPPLGTPNAGRSADLDALASYIQSLATTGDSPARSEAATLPAAATSGRTLFKSRNCASCHSGPEFTNSAIGVLRNIGTLKPSSGKRLDGPLTGLDVPSLRGLWATAPYLHDGSAATLGDAVTAHSGVSLTPTELTQLVAYIRNLDDAIPAAAVPLTVQLASATTSATTPFVVTASFSSVPTGFTLSDIAVTNGTASGLSGSGTGFSFTVTPTRTGTLSISIAANNANDAEGDGNQPSNTLQIVVPNRPPAVTNPLAQSTPRGTPVSLQVLATEADGLPLTYTATGLPPGLTLAAATGQITGTPTTAATSSVTLTATNPLGAATSVTFSWTITPAVLTEFAETFDAPSGLDASRWVIGTPYGEVFAPVDPLISVVQQSGRLAITPRTNTGVEGYRGIVSQDRFDLRSASVSVEVTPSGGTSNTWLALGSGTANFLVIGREGSVLWIEQMVNGGRDAILVNYDAAAHRQWRIRHDSATDRILFQLSPDGNTWTTARSIPRAIDITSMRLELAAGSFVPETAPGVALFDNLRFTRSGTAPIIQSFTASPSDITTGSTSTLSWAVTSGSAPLTSLTLNGTNVLGVTSLNVSPNTSSSYTLVATSSQGSVSSTLNITVRPAFVGNSYAAWVAAYGGTGNPAADADGDSYPEGLEYALGLDPSSGSTTRSTVPGANPAINRAVRMERTFSPQGDRRFDLVFTRPRQTPSDIGYGYWLESSANMETWGICANLNGAGDSSIPDILQITVTDLGDGTEEVRAGFRHLPSLFLRLAVYLPGHMVRSAPFGWMNRSIHTAENLIAPPFARESLYGGNYTWNASVLTDAAATWTPNQWLGHFVHITSGPAEGAMLQISGNTAKSLSFTGEAEVLLSLLDRSTTGTFVIRRSHTLASLFGADNRDALFTGDPSGADVISFLNPDSSFSDFYFRNSTLGGSGWRSMADPFTDASQRILPPTEALYLRRPNTTNSNLFFSGEVITGRRHAPIRSGISLPGTWNVIERSNLDTLGVESIFTATPTATLESNIYLEIGTDGGLYPHYLKTNVGWRFVQFDSTPMGTTVFPATASWLFYRFGSQRLWTRNPPFNYSP